MTHPLAIAWAILAAAAIVFAAWDTHKRSRGND